MKRGGRWGGWERTDWWGERQRGFQRRRRSSWHGSRSSFCGRGGWRRRRIQVCWRRNGRRVLSMDGVVRGRCGEIQRGCWWGHGRQGSLPERQIRCRRRWIRWWLMVEGRWWQGERVVQRTLLPLFVVTVWREKVLERENDFVILWIEIEGFFGF